jgi:hypothetical protein
VCGEGEAAAEPCHWIGPILPCAPLKPRCLKGEHNVKKARVFTSDRGSLALGVCGEGGEAAGPCLLAQNRQVHCGPEADNGDAEGADDGHGLGFGVQGTLTNPVMRELIYDPQSLEVIMSSCLLAQNRQVHCGPEADNGDAEGADDMVMG